MNTTSLKISLLLTALLTSTAAGAFNLGETLKGAVEKQKQDAAAPAQTSAGTESKPASASFNLKKPSQQEEIQLGREITGNLLGASALVKDDALQQYVNQVGRWVALQSERADLPWHFGVIESNDVNAFAAPGGYVIITKGLYRKLGSEADLAGVLAHEIGHVIKKHHLKVIQKQQLLSMGANLLGDSIGKDNNTVQKLIGSGAEICARSLDKDAEFEADRIGVVLAGRAGYDPYGLPTVLQEIGHSGKDDGSVALLFKTHPHPDDRLARLGTAIGNRLDKVTDGKTLEDRLYKLKD